MSDCNPIGLLRYLGLVGSCLSLVLIVGCAEINEIYQDVNAVVELAQRDRTPTYDSVFKAAEYGDPPAVEKFIRAGASVNATNSDGCSLVVLAVGNKNPQTLRWLIEAGADIKATNRFKETVLHKAVSSDNEAAVRILIDAGADLEARDQNGATPFFEAAWLGRKVAPILLAAGADPHTRDNSGATALMKSATVCHLEGIHLLLKAGVDVNATGKHGNTALMQAAGMSRGLMNEFNKLTEDHVSLCVGELLAQGADVHARNTIDNTSALLLATKQGYPKIVAQLIAAGAKVDVPDRDGYTPLIEAAKAGYLEVVTVLLQAGADPKLKDRVGRNAIKWAEDYPEIVRLLGGEPVTKAVRPQPSKEDKARLEKILFDLGYRDFNQDMFVNSAVSGKLEAVKAFLAYGLPVDSKSRQGHAMTPLLATAMYAESPAIGLLLIEAGANVNAQDENGSTPLLWAAQKCHLHDLVNALIKAGANVDAKAAGGATPLMMAEIFQCQENVKILKQVGAKE